MVLSDWFIRTQKVMMAYAEAAWEATPQMTLQFYIILVYADQKIELVQYYSWQFGRLAPILRSAIFQIYKVKMWIAIRSFCQRIHKNRTLPSVIVFFDPTSESAYEPDFVMKSREMPKTIQNYQNYQNVVELIQKCATRCKWCLWWCQVCRRAPADGKCVHTAWSLVSQV